jgi:hypothetical protein
MQLSSDKPDSQDSRSLLSQISNMRQWTERLAAQTTSHDSRTGVILEKIFYGRSCRQRVTGGLIVEDRASFSSQEK